jgi:hypothetical protein
MGSPLQCVRELDGGLWFFFVCVVVIMFIGLGGDKDSGKP